MPPRVKPLTVMNYKLLGLYTAQVDGLEEFRIACDNRLRILVTPLDEVDKDGKTRGFGLDPTDPALDSLRTVADGIQKLESVAIHAVEKAVRATLWREWLDSERSKGVGAKQLARLLGAIGDPYWHPVENRPRQVSELWSYCGYAVVKGQAPRRKRGEKSNWSETARKRAWLIATSCMKAGGPYRDVYDTVRARYEGGVHEFECVRCGPSGKPAQIGSPLSAGHIHARALRGVAKEVLKDLWLESRRQHEATIVAAQAAKVDGMQAKSAAKTVRKAIDDLTDHERLTGKSALREIDT